MVKQKEVWADLEVRGNNVLTILITYEINFNIPPSQLFIPKKQFLCPQLTIKHLPIKCVF